MSLRILELWTLSPAEGFVIPGERAGDLTGFSVSSAGDINGDGFADAIVGAPYAEYTSPEPGPGEAYVLFGGAGTFGEPIDGRQLIDLTTLTPAAGFVIRGEALSDQAGCSVSSAGDINGDGFADLIIGAPTNDDGDSQAGAAYVLFGGEGGFGATIDGRQVVDLATLTPAEGFVIQGGQRGDWAGWRVSAAGDVDGDGFSDVIIGTNNRAGVGEAYVVFGGGGGFGTTVDGRQVVDLGTLSPSRGFVIQGAAALDSAFESVSGAGDVNGDGFADLIVTSYSEHFGSGHTTGAYVVFGGADGFGETVDGRQVVDLSTLSGGQGFVIHNGTSSVSSVSAAGDVNGDGFGDLLVSGPANGEIFVVFGGADGFGATVDGRQVVDVTTLTAAQGFVMQSTARGDRQVSAAGDVNGDGFDDLIIGFPEVGAALVVFGGADTLGTAIDGRQVLDLTRLSETQGIYIRHEFGYYIGYSVSTAGDLNGDGFDDLIFGMNQGNVLGSYGSVDEQFGYAYVVFGGDFSEAVAEVGGDGDDRIDSGAAGQTIFGAAGDDTLFGNRGGDSLNGGAGDDSLNGGADDDTLAGGSGDDSAVGGRGHDWVLGGDGGDTLSGRAGDDTLAGEANDDDLRGNAGDDSLDGGQGRDVLRGGAGDDTLVGGGRGDVLIGGEGADVLTGGTGGDRLVFTAGSSSQAAPDTVTDFRGGFDRLEIHTGADHGSFLGDGAFTGTGGIEVRWDAGLDQLQVDLNGDGVLGDGDLVIAGASLATLGAHDLLFT